MGLLMWSPKRHPLHVLRVHVAVADDDVVPLCFNQSSNMFKAPMPLPLSSLHKIFAKVFWSLEADPDAPAAVVEVAEEHPL